MAWTRFNKTFRLSLRRKLAAAISQLRFPTVRCFFDRVDRFRDDAIPKRRESVAYDGAEFLVDRVSGGVNAFEKNTIF